MVWKMQEIERKKGDHRVEAPELIAGMQLKEEENDHYKNRKDKQSGIE
jgi:hypothetical protein